jgi:hypothetical protein
MAFDAVGLGLAIRSLRMSPHIINGLGNFFAPADAALAAARQSRNRRGATGPIAQLQPLRLGISLTRVAPERRRGNRKCGRVAGGLGIRRERRQPALPRRKRPRKHRGSARDA